jgi:hypothetical protein
MGWMVRTHPDWPWGPTSLQTMANGSFPVVKQQGHEVDHPHPSSTKVKERVELYIYSTSGPLWPIIGWTLSLPLPLPLQWSCELWVTINIKVFFYVCWGLIATRSFEFRHYHADRIVVAEKWQEKVNVFLCAISWRLGGGGKEWE